MKISIVVPTYNEEKRIGKAIEIIWEFFQKRGNDFEIIVVDDGSLDKTVEVVRRLKAKFPNLILLSGKHKGKGMTVKAGMEKAAGDIVLFTDADLAAPIEEFEKFRPEFEKGIDVVIGSRGIKREGAPIVRWIMAWGLNFLARIFLGLNFSDTQCGFKAFKKSGLTKIIPKLKIYADDKEILGARVSASFDLELLFLAKKFKFNIAQVPVVWHHQASRAVRPVTESILTLIDIFKIKINDILGQYS